MSKRLVCRKLPRGRIHSGYGRPVETSDFPLPIAPLVVFCKISKDIKVWLIHLHYRAAARFALRFLEAGMRIGHSYMVWPASYTTKIVSACRRPFKGGTLDVEEERDVLGGHRSSILVYASEGRRQQRTQAMVGRCHEGGCVGGHGTGRPWWMTVNLQRIVDFSPRTQVFGSRPGTRTR